jgi:drug/metabolite transporter (DMT)-like permease
MSDRIDTGMRRRGLTLALAAALVSGVAVFVNSYGVRAVPDATVYTTAKNLVAAALLVGAALAWPLPARPRVPRFARPTRPAHLVGLGAVAVIGGSVPFVLFFEGLARASSSQAAFVHKTLLVWVALLAVPLLGERLRGLQVAAIGLLLAGQAVLGGGLSGFRFGAGEGLILAATLLWAVEVVLAKWLLRDVAPRVVGVVRMAAGAILLVAWVGATGRWSALVGLDRQGWAWAALTGTVLAGYVALWFSALALAPAVDVTAVLVPAAVVTGVLNVAVKGVAATDTTVAGMLIVLTGAAMAAAARTRRPTGSAVTS